jgi:hypothetical protein
MNISDDGCNILLVRTQGQTWRQCEISTSYTVRLKSTETLFHNKTKRRHQRTCRTQCGRQDNSQSVVGDGPDAGTLKCYSCHVAQQCTCQLQGARLALQARTNNIGHHLPETKKNRRYNLRAFRARNNLHKQKQSHGDCPGRLLRNYMRAEEGA